MWRTRIRGSFWFVTALLLAFWTSECGLAQDSASLDVSSLVPEAAMNPLLVSAAPTNPLLILAPIHPLKPATAERRANSKLFLVLGTGTYVAASLDMHETMVVKRAVAHFQENDPLAEPFTRLPTPAYYAVGTAMVTGLDWISLRMAHSTRWHRVWWLPQVLAIGGNMYGYGYSKRTK